MLVISLTTLSSCGGAVTQGRELEKAGDLESAVTVYQEALRADPENVEILAALGVDLMLLGRWDEALPVQETAVRLDANDAQTRIELGFNYLNHQDRSADAAEVLAEAVALDPSAKNLTFLAQAQAANDDMAAAEASLRASIEKDPKYPRAYTLLIGLLEDAGRVSDALVVRQAATGNGVEL